MKTAVIGYGKRISKIVDIMREMDGSCEVAAITDIRNEEIEEQLKQKGYDTRRIRFFTDADEMLASGSYDGVLIGTRCSLHAKMACKVFAAGIPLYLEKPVATNMDDLVMLRNAYVRSGSRVVISFPLRMTRHVQLVREIADSGRIGTIEHVQAVNNVPYGGIYYHKWYRDENETQGLFLQKATHDFDYINYVLGLKPVRVCALKSKRVFRGSMPAGLRCDKCGIQKDCPESPYNLKWHGLQEPVGPWCSFAVDTGNEDNGSALVEYETGMHVSYSQNFITRRSAGKRGATFIGYKGTIEFDWYLNEVKVIMHQSPRVETYKFEDVSMSDGHGGGDYVLVESFIEQMKGGGKESVSPMEAGLLSALMCLKAKESAETYQFKDIEWPE